MMQQQRGSLDHGTPPERFARGWHCLGLARSFRDGKPHGIEAFGSKLVVWADTAGRAQRARRLLPAHGRRPHPGHGQGRRDRLPVPRLALGRRRQVQGRSPTPGGCRCGRAPRSTPSSIRNGQLLVWHDVEGSEPDLDILPPVLPGVGTDGLYTDWTWEVVADPDCALPRDHRQRRRHGALLLRPLRVPDELPQRLRGPRRDPVHGVEGPPRHRRSGYGDADLFLKSEATYFGPSYMINWLDVDYKGFETEVILINCHIPTGQNSFTLQYGVTRQEARGRRRRDRRSTSRKKYAEMFEEGFLQDVHIWKNKVPVQNPLLCEEDGPVYQLRRWYEQFYVDEADIVAGDDGPVRVRGRHHQGQRVLAGGGRGEPAPQGAEEEATAEASAAPCPDHDGHLSWPRSSRPAPTRWRTSGSTPGPAVEVACLDCLARVGVKKNSEHHTSIQWTAEARAHCPELTRRAGWPRRPAPAARGWWPASSRPRATGGADRRRGRVLRCPSGYVRPPS